MSGVGPDFFLSYLCGFIPEILTTITYRHPGKYKKKATYIGFREMRYSPVVFIPASSGRAKWMNAPK